MLSRLSEIPWRQGFVVGVAAVLLITLMSNTVWWLTVSAFSSLLILNLHFLLFPNTEDRHGLNRVSMGIVFALFIIANIKFFIVTGLFFS